MALERNNIAERLARIDKLMAENKPTPGFGVGGVGKGVRLSVSVSALSH